MATRPKSKVIKPAVVVPVRAALCVRTKDVLPFVREDGTETGQFMHALPFNFYDIPTLVQDRAFCETDETLLQLLPYIVIVNSKNEVFMYSRGKGGAEARLHALQSIGVGGHVDTEPGLGDSLRRHLIAEAMREVVEEIGIVPVNEPEFTALIIDRTNPVGRVHLGLLAMCHIDAHATLMLEENNIENGQWVPVSEIHKAEYTDKMENWSQMAVRHMFTPDWPVAI